MARPIEWIAHPRSWIEAFVLANVSFLAVDICFAHSVNAFRHPAEWIPFAFSIASSVVLLVAIVADMRGRVRLWRALGAIVGVGALVVGFAGFVLHLESQFFEQQTIKHLVYTAPFAAPLAYVGLGFLLIMNRMVADDSAEWGWWVVFFAMGGFAGNFTLSLADHAQNGFYFATEWVAVIAGAFGFAFLLTALLVRVGGSFVRWCVGVMIGEALVGLLGFTLHLRADVLGSGGGLWDGLIYGAPVFAPLLFPNLVVLALIGLWAMGHVAGGAPVGPAGPAHRTPAA